MDKKWYTSKTIYVNVLAFVAGIVANKFGYTISPELTASILVIINVILRAITKTNLTW